MSERTMKEKRSGKPFVTISFEVGAYGLKSIEGVSAYLQKHDRRKGAWNIFDKNLAEKVMEDYKLSMGVLPYFSESTASEIEDIIESTLGLHPSRIALVHEMNVTILGLAQKGNAILVGRGSNMVTAHLPKGVHVRLIGSFEKRMEYFVTQLRFKEKEAKEFIPKEDERRANYFKKYFNKDINDPSLYDLVINVDRLSIDDIVRQVGHLIIKRETLV